MLTVKVNNDQKTWKDGRFRLLGVRNLTERQGGMVEYSRQFSTTRHLNLA